MPDGFLPAHGGYADLLSYRKAVIVYDATRCFCDRFLRPITCWIARSGNWSRIFSPRVVFASG